MGYGSRIYIVDGYGITLATMDMDQPVNYLAGWQELFDKPYKKGLYPDMESMPIPEDCEYSIFYKDESTSEYEPVDYLPAIKFHKDRYEQPLMYANANDVYDWCKVNRKEYYRIDALYGLLGVLIPGFQKRVSEPLYVVLFGY